MKKTDLKTFSEVSTLLRVSKTTLYKWIDEGIITCVKIGGRVLFEQSEIDRVVETNRVVKD